MDFSNKEGFDESVLDEIRKFEENLNNLLDDESLLDEVLKFEENLKANMKYPPDDFDSATDEEMATLWKQLCSQVENGEDCFPPFFLHIMRIMLAKNVLYPSLKDLSTKVSDE